MLVLRLDGASQARRAELETPEGDTVTWARVAGDSNLTQLQLRRADGATGTKRTRVQFESDVYLQRSADNDLEVVHSASGNHTHTASAIYYGITPIYGTGEWSCGSLAATSASIGSLTVPTSALLHSSTQTGLFFSLDTGWNFYSNLQGQSVFKNGSNYTVKNDGSTTNKWSGMETGWGGIRFLLGSAATSTGVDTTLNSTQFNASERLSLDTNGALVLGAGGASSNGVGVFELKAAGTVPSTNPTSAGVLYVDNTTGLCYRGSGGTLTVLAPP